MIKKFLTFVFLLIPIAAFSQTGHLMQGIGAVNMSMGGASTAQPLDISGALEWNPASISVFSGKTLKVDAGLFFSSPELSSTYGTYSGVTKDQKGVSIMPAISYVWGKEGCKNTFGVSAFGISGFGVDFPENSANPISMSQANGGFGHLESNYMLMQIGFSWAYQISDKLSIGIQPNIDYSALKLNPNPLATPSSTLGYPKTNNATAIGYGAQVGLYYDSQKGFKAGASYKTQQAFSKFNFKDTYLDGSDAGKVKFQMNYPAILSLGLGYSVNDFDFAVDYRYVDYEHTKGFEAKGWATDADSNPTGSVNGFGWKNISTVSAGIQYKGINKFPIRIGYTYSGNPIDKELAFFSLPATAIIKNAVQCGFSYVTNSKISVDFAYHHGMSSGSTTGSMLSPYAITSTNPYGKVDGSSVSYKMTTDLLMVGVSYKFN